MAITLGDAILYLRGDDKQLKSDLDKVNGTVRGWLGSLARTAAVGIAAAGGAVLTGGALAVKAAAEYEQTQIAFQTMLGDAERAKNMLADLAQFAANTPFQLHDVEMGARQLLAMGANAEDVIPELKMLGDVSAGLNVPMERLILNYGQVRTQNKLTGREMRDFLIAGVPLVDELAKMFGVTKDQISDMVSRGEVDFATVQQAFANMTSEGGKFFDLMDNQSQTTAGKWANFKDQVQLRLREIGAALLPLANRFLDFASDKLPLLADAFMERVIPAIETFTERLDFLKPALQSLFDLFRGSEDPVGRLANVVYYLAQALGLSEEDAAALFQKILELREPIENVIDFLGKHSKEIVGALLGIGVALAGLQLAALIGGIVTALGFLLTPVGLLIAGAALLGAAWAGNWGGIQEKTQAVIDFLGPMISSFIQSIRDWWAEHGDSIVAKAQEIWDGIKEKFEYFKEQYKRLFDAFRLAQEGDWEGFGKKIREIWDNIWLEVTTTGKENLKKIRDWFVNTDWAAVGKSILAGIAEGVTNGAKALTDAVVGAARAAFEAAKGFLGIESPSKLFKYEVGQQIPDGLVEGITGRTEHLRKAVQDMLGEVTPGSSGFQIPGLVEALNGLRNTGPFAPQITIHGSQDPNELIDVLNYYNQLQAVG